MATSASVASVRAQAISGDTDVPFGGKDPLHNRTLTTEERFREGYKRAVAEVERLARVVADPTHFDSGRLEDAATLLSELQSEGIGVIRVYDAIYDLQNSADYHERQKAAIFLGDSKLLVACKALCEHGLTDKKWVVRASSAIALASHHTEQAAEALLETGLKDSHQAVCRASAQSLRSYPESLRQKVGVENRDEEMGRQAEILRTLSTLNADHLEKRHGEISSQGKFRRFLGALLREKPETPKFWKPSQISSCFNDDQRVAVEASLEELESAELVTGFYGSGSYGGRYIKGYQLSESGAEFLVTREGERA